MTAHAGDDVRQGATHPLLVGLQACMTTMEVGMAIPQEVENRSHSRNSYTDLRHMPKRYPLLFQRHLLIHIHFYSFYKIQKLEKA